MNYREAMERALSEETPELLLAKQEYPINSVVYLNETGQYGVVSEHNNSADGVLLRVSQIGLVPIKEIRKVTEEERETYLKK